MLLFIVAFFIFPQVSLFAWEGVCWDNPNLHFKVVGLSGTYRRPRRACTVRKRLLAECKANRPGEKTIMFWTGECVAYDAILTWVSPPAPEGKDELPLSLENCTQSYVNANNSGGSFRFTDLEIFNGKCYGVIVPCNAKITKNNECIDPLRNPESFGHDDCPSPVYTLEMSDNDGCKYQALCNGVRASEYDIPVNCEYVQNVYNNPGFDHSGYTGIPDSIGSTTGTVTEITDPETNEKTVEYNLQNDYSPILEKLNDLIEADSAAANYNNDRADARNSQLMSKIGSSSDRVVNAINGLKTMMGGGISVTVQNNNDVPSPDMTGVENRLDTANDHLSAIENNISGIAGFFGRMGDLINDPSSIGDSIQSSVGDIASRYIGQDVIDMPECGTVPTIGTHMYGRDIVFLSEDIINQWPIDIFRVMIIFFFGLSGVIVTFRGS